ncbi:CAAX protease self-immunity [Eubacterium ruminantium]|nr:CAAX protease self-immunity [Eubacterium ruminantium]
MKEQRRSLTDNLKPNIKTIGGLALIFVPILLTYVIDIISYFADFALVFIMNNYLGMDIDYDNTEAFYGVAPVNSTLLLFLYALLCLIIFGWWYSLLQDDFKPDKTAKNHSNNSDKTSKKNNNAPDKNELSAKDLLISLGIMAAAGFSFQLFVDGILAVIRTAFPNLLQDYDSMINSFIGDNKSVILILTVIIITPAAEELIFRGVTLHFCRKVMPETAAILVSAALFGLYHGNIIQLIYAFVAGAILALLRIKTGSIIAPMIMHMIINMSAYLVPGILFDNLFTTILTMIASLGILYLVYRHIKLSADEITE